MGFHERFGLTPVINACGKMTRLSNARALPEVIRLASESLEHFFLADELQALASRRIAAFSGAEAGCVTACAAAGITLSVAAAMTGTDPALVERLPDTEGMKNEVVIQKGHAVNFGAPITQMIRLAGARPVEAGNVNGTTPAQMAAAIGERTAAVLFVVSHHTAQYGCVPLAETVRIAHARGVPVIVDGAAQSFNLRRIVAAGADLAVCSGHKYLSGTVSGLVCGRRHLVEAVLMQNQGIGRPMKVGKEGIFGLIAALEARERLDVAAFSAEVRERVEKVRAGLAGRPGVTIAVAEDPNGNPFCRARVFVDGAAAGLDARAVVRAAAGHRPAVILRGHHVDEGYFDVDVVELNPEELEITIRTLQGIFDADGEKKAAWQGGSATDPRFQWLGSVPPAPGRPAGEAAR